MPAYFYIILIKSMSPSIKIPVVCNNTNNDFKISQMYQKMFHIKNVIFTVI